MGGAAGISKKLKPFFRRFNAARGFVGGAAKSRANHTRRIRCFNAARGFVGGAAGRRFRRSCADRVSMPHAALWVVQRDKKGWFSMKFTVSMPHAALWVVQPRTKSRNLRRLKSFNAARGFVGGAAANSVSNADSSGVSMPHAALWVVQPRRSQLFSP